jgi:hypothetical protein
MGCSFPPYVEISSPVVPTGFLTQQNTGRFKMLSVVTNLYNNKTKGPTLKELFTATGKIKLF